MTKNTKSPLIAGIKPALPNFIRGGTPFSNHIRRFKNDKEDGDDENEDGDDSSGKKKQSEKTYTQAEFSAALDKVRTEEKAKLRATVDAEKARADKAADDLKSLTATVADLNARVTAFKDATDKDGKAIDVDTLLEKYAAKFKPGTPAPAVDPFGD